MALARDSSAYQVGCYQTPRFVNGTICGAIHLRNREMTRLAAGHFDSSVART
jgi:hypothetical protein